MAVKYQASALIIHSNLLQVTFQGLQFVRKLRLSHGKESCALAGSAHVLYSRNKRCTRGDCRLGPGVR